jgi:DeoR/GlpR family transcriptional regulator of sugar metabolism
MNSIEQPLKIERQAQIRRLAKEKRQVTVTELSSVFSVSEATIRRDLEELDGQGLQRTHGGAVWVEQAMKEPPIIQRMAEQAENKRRIGQAAAALVKDGQTIFLGSGTTPLEIARQLPKSLRLTVISNSLAVVNELADSPNVELVVVGGLFRHSELSMIGHPAEMVVREFRADKVFLGMRAIDIRQGFTNDYMPEILTDRAILAIGSEVIIVSDHTKFGRVSSVFVSPVTAAHIVITDADISSEIAAEIRELGIRLIIV